MTGNTWWIGPFVLVLLRLLYVEALSTRASAKGTALVFRAATGGLALLALTISVMLVLLVRSIGHEETWIMVLGVTSIAFLCLGWPSTIVIDAAGISRRIWWKPTVHISWDKVVQLERGADGDWTVYGSDGETIAFSRFHADPVRFETEVLRRAKLPRSKDRSSPTSLFDS